MIDYSKAPVELPEEIGWHILAGKLCQTLEIPDLNKRSGFKQAHKDFDAIQKRLIKMFNAFPGNETVQGGIALIWAKLCSDGMLRDRLVHEGLIERLLPLLGSKRVRFIALRLLASIGNHAGHTTRVRLKAVTTSLLTLLDEERGDDWIEEMCAITLCAGLTSVLAEVTEPIPLSSPFPWARALDSMLDLAAAYPSPDDNIFDYATMFLVVAPQALRLFYLENERALGFLCALVHCESMELRLQGLQGLLRFPLHVAGNNKFDRYIPPQRLMKEDWPKHIRELFAAYGHERCDIPLALSSEHEYKTAMWIAGEDLDLVALGRKVYAVLIRCELGLSKGTFLLKTTGKPYQTRLPFLYWEDGLEHCAKALRALGPDAKFAVDGHDVSALDMADALTAKAHLMHNRPDAACAVALAGLARNPAELFFYYAVGLAKASDSEEKLKISRKGLTSARMPPAANNYLRLGLLMNSSEHALFLAFEHIEEAFRGLVPWGRVVALLKISLDDSRAFLRDAAPDNKNYGRVLISELIATLALEGNTVGSDLGKIKASIRTDKLERLKICDEIAHAVYAPPVPTQFLLGLEAFIKYNAAGCVDWASMIKRLQSPSKPSQTKIPSAPEGDKDLIEWLDAETGSHRKPEHPTKTLIAKWGDDALALYCCSSCGNASAVLRKCARCGKARYCDQAW
ncbi:hypothetical protein AURDEDRAFT_173862 [Auricularia subglabra TFB-10046 SS5]|uniref:MYND-type domain-containing protein n=1 Tax=Auricularia subglabra (strain TFB-10046 / SS5) TaxID=717982 RepID=J0DAD2_AURST|nr:hypothetical protein AURDEDRAFT_173862 [Auricularia subglabra TFB-10046 SS5]